MDQDQARQRAWLLFRSLEKMSERDPDQEVRGIAVPVLDAVLQACKPFVPEDPIIGAIREVVSADVIAAGKPVRGVDAVVVAEQLAVALGPEVVPGPVSGPMWGGPRLYDQGF